jgi:hypothetical protein
MVDAHLFVVETDEADADDVCVCRWNGYMYRYEASVCSLRTEAATDDAKRSCAEAADTRDGVMATVTWCIMVLDRLLCSCRLLDCRGPRRNRELCLSLRDGDDLSVPGETRRTNCMVMDAAKTDAAILFKMQSVSSNARMMMDMGALKARRSD